MLEISYLTIALCGRLPIVGGNLKLTVIAFFEKVVAIILIVFLAGLDFLRREVLLREG